MNVPLYTVSLLLAALMGFAVHRASLCTVKTVGEILSSRKAYMLATLAKAVFWVVAVSGPVLLCLPYWAAPHRSYAVTFTAVGGGFLFGVGAAVNGGCAFSTLGQLANGNLWMLTTLFGFCMGVAGLSIMGPTLEPSQNMTPLLLKAPKQIIIIGLALLWLLACWEIARLWRSRDRGKSGWQLFLSRHYRLSTAALLCGMILSAWQRGSLRLRWRRIQAWPRHLLGGTLMGAGAVLIPGGNDTLILKSLPGLSPHAIPAFAALLLGICATLLLMRLFTGKTIQVACINDICRTEN